MPNFSGQNFSTTDPLKPAPGSTVDAGSRKHREVFNTTTHTLSGTTNGAIAAKQLREGNTLIGVTMKCSADLSALTFTVGNATTVAKYAAAQAGGAANVTKTFEILLAALDDDPLTAPEDIVIYPSGNWPAGATIVTFVEVLKR